MAKITPKIRTVLLIIFLTGSYITTYANYTPSILNFLDIEYEGESVIVPDRLKIPEIPTLNEIPNSQVFIDNVIEYKISELFANHTLKARIQNKILRQNLTQSYFKFSNANIFSEYYISESTFLSSNLIAILKKYPEVSFSKSFLAIPSISLGANPEVCKGTTIAYLSYSNPSENPDKYSISFSSTARTAGFSDITDATLPATSPLQIQIIVPNGSPGTYNATLTVTNGTETSGNISFSVIIKPIPVAVTKNITIELDSSGNASIAEDAVNNNSTDSCGGHTFSTDKTSYTCTDVGANIVTLTVTDINGNSDSTTAIVTVEDNVAPVALAKNITVQLNASGTISIAATDINNGSNDNCGISSMSVSPNSFTCANVGANTVTLTVTDNNSKVSTKTAVVTVEDNVAPVALAKNITVQLNASGTVSIAAADVDNGSNDPCGIKSMTVRPSSFTCVNVGTNTVTLTVTDNNDNVSTNTATVTVEDNVAPPAFTQNITVQLDANGNATITTADVDNGSNDACGIKSMTVSPSSFTCVNVGTNTVTLTVTDNNDNVSTNTATVTVEDNVAPIVLTQNKTVQLNASGNATITAADVDNGSNDACGIKSMTVSPSSFTCVNVGTNTVTLTVTDNNNNVSTNTATVTVEDNVAPIVLTQNITVQLDASGNATITAADVDNGSNDVCGIPSLALSQTDFNCTEVGANKVTLTVTDINGNISTADATVMVADNIIPVITPNSNLSVNNDVGLCGAFVSIIAPTASDNCTVGIPAGTRNDGKVLTALFPAGLTTISWTVTDTNGNNAIPIEQTVTVLDNEAPVAPLLGDIIWGCEYTVSVPEATDNCDVTVQGSPNRSLVFTSSGSITWTFTDGAENFSTATQQITIDQLKVDVEQTNILCYGFATGEAEAIVTGGVGPFTYDWGPLGTGPSKDGLNPGSYSVTVKDKNGCSATKPFSITQPGSFIEITNVEINQGCFEDNNAFAIITASGGTGILNYSWSNGQTGPKASNLASGDYTVTVTDENNCSKVKPVKIIAPSQLVIDNISTTETTSFDSATGTATVNFSGGTPGYTFLWSNGQTSQTASGLLAGTYDVTVSDANGCKTAKKIVKIYNTLYTEIEASAICATRTDEIRTSYFEAINTKGGSGTYVYSWTFGDNKPATSGPGQHIVKYDSSGQKTIILTLTDNDTGRLKPDGSKFTYTSTIIIYAGECFGKCGSEDLRTDEVYIGNGTGSPYNVTQNCEDVENEALWINITEPGNSSRYNFYTEYVVLLYHPDGTVTEYSSIGQCSLGLIDRNKPLKITNIDYKCGDRISVEKFFMSVSSNQNGGCNSYTDGPKCNASDKPIDVVTPLSGAVKDGELLCNGASNGKITATASGGQGKYQFTIKSTTTNFTVTSGFQTGGKYIFENLKADTYNVIIKDEGGRTYTVSNVKIIQPSNPLQLIEVSRKPLTCNGGNNAEVTVNASGGTAPYIYVWKNGQTTKTAINLSAGPNEVKVIDKNGCEVPLIIDIVQPPILVANAGPDQILNCGVTQVKLSAVFNPYTNPATGVQEFGEWTVVNGPVGSNFADFNNPENLFTIQTPGTYSLRWTVPCGATDDVKITISNCSTIDFDGIDDHIDFGDNFNPSGNFTFEAWIKQNTNASAGIKTILSKRDPSNLSTGFDLILDNGTPKFRWNNSEITSSNAIGKDRWYHLAVISNGSGTKLYVDGINVGNGAVASPIDNNFKFLIGAMYDSGTALNPKNYFHGWIEEVRIWKTALTEEQLRFMMNQRIEANNSNVRGVKGVEIPLDVPKDLAGNNLAWDNLKGYYQMEKVANGFTIGETGSAIKGKLINIITTQERTAPLPYISARAGLWFDDTTWLHPQVWDAPNSNGINSETINWNIARVSHNINSGGKDITVLGLLSKSAKLTIAKPGESLDEKNSGQSLTVTHYLELNGNIDLVGESQLLQTEGSVLKEESTGFIKRDQQGTANSYNYNYWSSPVSLQGAANNSTYTIGSVMLDGTNSATPLGLSFHDWYEYADGPYATPRKISNYWLYKFRGTSNVYSEWERVGSTGTLFAGEGYTMKGTSGGAAILDRQNYVFKGKPNNGNITLTVGPDQNYLLGNPYPSALDADQFIKDNLKDGGTNTVGNIFNGALYFWDHFAGKTHILAEYIGGYATYNLSGGVPAVATDERINNTGQSSRDYFADEAKIPQRYIPVAQGFFINTVLDPTLSPSITVDGGEVIFKNSQRAFIKETNTEGNSQFLRPETNSQKDKQADTPSKIRLDFRSPMGYHRQILVGADPNTTNGFDLGYDAPLNDYNLEDMFWLIDNIEFVIQGVPNFGIDQVLPLGIKINETGVFSIKINKLENVADNVNIYLKNLQDSTYFDLRKGDYSMNLDPGNYYESFQIVFQKEKVPPEEPDPVEETEEETEEEPDPVVETEEESEEESVEEVIAEEEQEQEAVETAGDEEILDGGIKVFYVGNNREIAVLNPSKFKIERIVIYDMLGQIIQEYQNISNEKEVRLPVREFPAAVYAIKLYSGNKEISKSIILIR